MQHLQRIFPEYNPLYCFSCFRQEQLVMWSILLYPKRPQTRRSDLVATKVCVEQTEQKLEEWQIRWDNFHDAISLEVSWVKFGLLRFEFLWSDKHIQKGTPRLRNSATYLGVQLQWTKWLYIPSYVDYYHGYDRIKITMACTPKYRTQLASWAAWRKVFLFSRWARLDGRAMTQMVPKKELV